MTRRVITDHKALAMTRSPYEARKERFKKCKIIKGVKKIAKWCLAAFLVPLSITFVKDYQKVTSELIGRLKCPNVVFSAETLVVLFCAITSTIALLTFCICTAIYNSYCWVVKSELAEES